MSDHLTTDRPAKGTSLPGRTELLLVALVTLVALALRIAWPSRLAVEHFDEGVYASNLFFHDRAGPGHYPDQHLYAPPLLPFLVESSMIVLGASNFAALVVNVCVGALTAPLVWFIGRRWFGSTAGLAAATLLAINDVHIFFSRTALTDVLLCFFLAGAVFFFYEALTTRNRLAIFAAGATTGLAWWTKYNGWLPLVIGLAALVPWSLTETVGPLEAEQILRISARLAVRKLPRRLGRWSIVACIAFLIWLPWLVSLQAEGGYAAVAANHRDYLVGLSEWTNSFAMQARKLSLLDGIPTGCSLLVVLGVSIVRLRQENPRFTWNMLLWNEVMFFALPVAILMFVIEGANVVLTTLGGVGILLGTGRLLKGQIAAGPGEVDRAESAGNALPVWLLAAWFAGLIVTIPLYTAYPRLMLPLLVASWLGAGLLIDAIIAQIRSHADDLQHIDRGTKPLLNRDGPQTVALARARPIFILAIGAAIVLSAGQRSPLARGIPGWESRTGLADLAPAILDDACHDAGIDRERSPEKFVIYCYAEPALLFNLRLSGAEFVNPVQDVAFADPDAPAPRLASFVVIGPQAWRTLGFGEQLVKALPRLQLVGKYRYVPSRLVVLDGSDRSSQQEIALYRVK